MFNKLINFRRKNILIFNYAIFGFPVSHSLSPILMKYFCTIFNKKKGKYFKIKFNTLRINTVDILKLNDKREKDIDLNIHFANYTTPFKIKQELIKDNLRNFFDNFNTFSIYSNKIINTDYLGIFYSFKDKLKIKENVDYSIIIGKGNTAFSAIKALNIFRFKNISIFYRKEDNERFLIIKNVFRNIKFDFRNANNIKDYFKFINKEIEMLNKNKGKMIIINTSDEDIIYNYNLEEELRDIINSGFYIYILDLNYVKKPLSKWNKIFTKNFNYISPYEMFYYQGVFAFLFFMNSYIISNKIEVKKYNIDKILDKKFINHLLNNKNKFINKLKRYILKNYKFNISFLGFSYSGKSSVFKNLRGNDYISNFINNYYDLDELIEKDSNKSINEIFKDKGESYFRYLEYTLLRKILKKEKQILSINKIFKNEMDSKRIEKKLNILSLGGGILENKKSFNFVKKYFYNIFFFIDNFQIIYNRYLKEETKNRPIFNNNFEKIKNIYLNRFCKYLIVSDLIVNSSLNILELTKIIEKEIENLYIFLKNA